MLTSYFKIALRYLLKNRTFSAINIFGLTLGFLCFMLIALYLHDELSFDLFHRDSGRIYRLLEQEQQEDGTKRTIGNVAALLGPESVAQFPEVEDAVRILVLGRLTLGNDPATRSYEPLMTIDPNLFSFFDFPLLEGDPATALRKPDGVVLSERLARKYFGNEPALGKSLWSSIRRRPDTNGTRTPVEFTVTGILKEMPKNSHLQIDIIFSEDTWPTVFSWWTRAFTTDWTSHSFVTYIKLKPNADLGVVEEKFDQLAKAHYPADKPFRNKFTLQPLKDIHLHSAGIQGEGLDSNGIKPFYIYLFAAVSFLILLIACLNYMNLTTAAAYRRTREIGTRKTLGAQKGQLIAQFTGEAILLSGVALFIALAMLQIILPYANAFTQKDLDLRNMPVLWVTVLGVVMIGAGILSSLYPAYIISRVMPSDALKKDFSGGTRSLPMRKLLVAAQFAVSIMMIASTLVIYRQLQYMRSKDLGFDLSNLLVIDINSDRLRRNFESVKAEFARVPEVLQISTSTRVPGEWKSIPVAQVKADGMANTTEMTYMGIDKDFLSTYNIPLLQGRTFSGDRADSLKVVLTKLAVESLGLTDPVGKTIEIAAVRWGGSVETLEKPFVVEVIGVADNFHFDSFRQEMGPLIFAYANTVIQRIDYYTLRVKTDNWDKTLANLKEVNAKIDSENPLEYTFLDSRFEEYYQADAKRGQLFLGFSLVVVLIASLGLFALVSYSIESRKKEIGIRKVLGATVLGLVVMISWEFLAIVAFAGLAAIPAAWYVMDAWLSDFAYRVSLGVGTFTLAGILALVIAMLTVGLRTLQAARANPVDSLRSE